MNVDELMMARCIELAKNGAGLVSPNPMVGAVITVNNKIIGEGYHQKYGEAHAEVNAINQVFRTHPDAEKLLKKAKIYVSLEPCAHFGKTPPCADLIIKHQIPEVVIGCRDPFPEVNGKGLERLTEAGIHISYGILEKECLALNKRFFTRVQKQRPYIILKWAESQDGFIGREHEQIWLTNTSCKQLVHQWRAEEDCILVGYQTALVDNPQLNVRLAGGKQPKRAVIDKNLQLPKTLNIFNQEQETFIFNKTLTSYEGRNKFIGIEEFDYFLPQYLLYQLYLQDVQSLIVEGGSKTLAMFIENGLWDEARIFTTKHQLKNGIQAPKISGKIISEDFIEHDKLHVIINQSS